MKKLRKENPWIAKEERFFGQEGTQYEFKDVKKSALLNKKKEMEDEYDSLKKTINFSVETLYERALRDHE